MSSAELSNPNQATGNCDNTSIVHDPYTFGVAATASGEALGGVVAPPSVTRTPSTSQLMDVRTPSSHHQFRSNRTSAPKRLFNGITPENVSVAGPGTPSSRQLSVVGATPSQRMSFTPIPFHGSTTPSGRSSRASITMTPHPPPLDEELIAGCDVPSSLARTYSLPNFVDTPTSRSQSQCSVVCVPSYPPDYPYNVNMAGGPGYQPLGLFPGLLPAPYSWPAYPLCLCPSPTLYGNASGSNCVTCACKKLPANRRELSDELNWNQDSLLKELKVRIPAVLKNWSQASIYVDDLCHNVTSTVHFVKLLRVHFDKHEDFLMYLTSDFRVRVCLHTPMLECEHDDITTTLLARLQSRSSSSSSPIRISDALQMMGKPEHQIVAVILKCSQFKIDHAIIHRDPEPMTPSTSTTSTSSPNAHTNDDRFGLIPLLNEFTAQCRIRQVVPMLSDFYAQVLKNRTDRGKTFTDPSSGAARYGDLLRAVRELHTTTTLPYLFFRSSSH